MTGRILTKAIMMAGVLLALAGCNMYVIDFENKLPDGAAGRLPHHHRCPASA